MEGLRKPLSKKAMVVRHQTSLARDGLGSALFGIYHRHRAIGQGSKISDVEFRQELRISFQQGQAEHKECSEGALVLFNLDKFRHALLVIFLSTTPGLN